MDLFLQPSVSFEKVSAETALPEGPDQWPNAILQQLFKEVPYISEFEPHIEMDKVDAERGYALGHIEVTNKTEMQHGTDPETLETAGVQTARIPIIVKDRKLQPLDVLLTEGTKMLPLTEGRLRQAIFRPQAFDISARSPGDQSLVGQLFPPGRQMGGMGGGTSGMVVDAGSMGKIGGLARRRFTALGQGIPVDRRQVEPDDGQSVKSASILAAILPTINESDYNHLYDKLANDAGLRTAYGSNAAMADALETLSAYEPGTIAKMAAGIHHALVPSVVQIVTVPGEGYLVKSASHRVWAPETEIMDRGQLLRTFGEKIVLAADLNGAVTMATDGETGAPPAVEEEAPPADPAAAGATPDTASEQQDPEADKADLIEQFGVYKVQDEAGRHLIGFVFPNLIDIDGKSLPLAMFTNGGQRAIQGEIVGINVGAGMSLFEGEPQGMGAFYEVLPNGRAQATVPLTIKATMQMPESDMTFVAETFDGRPVQVMVQPNITKVTLVDGQMLVPDTFSWLPLDKAEEVSLASDPVSFQKTANPRNSLDYVQLRSDGSTFSLDGYAVDKLAAAERQFLNIDETMFLVAGLGVDMEYGIRKIASAAAHGRPIDVLVGREVLPASLVMDGAREKAAAQISRMGDFRRDLIKEAAVLPDPQAVDTVLSLGFINPENLATFIDHLPEIDAGQSRLCELLIAARLGVRELPIAALERAIRTTEEVIQGLKVLAFEAN